MSTYFVSATRGDDANAGTSWTQAFATIKEALDNVGPSDIIAIESGTSYSEGNLEVLDEGVTLRSVDYGEDGSAASYTRAIITGDGSDRIFISSSIGITLEALEIRANGANNIVYSISGGGTRSITLTDCIMKNAAANAISVAAYNLTLTDCEFYDCGGSGYDEAVYDAGEETDLTIESCLFVRSSMLRIANKTDVGSASLDGCTIVGDTKNQKGIWLEDSTSLAVSIVNTIFSRLDWDVWTEGNTSIVNLSYSCIDAINDSGTEPERAVIDGLGVVYVDPLFNDALRDDYTLHASSPCVNAGDPSSGLDTDGSRVEIGYYAYSAIKSNYAAFALARLLYQYQQSTNLRAIVSTVASQLQELENVAADVLSGRVLDVATGEQLDGVGQYAGLARSGMSDDEYRAAIRLQIARNNSQSNASSVFSIFALATLSDDMYLIELLPNGIQIFGDGSSLPDNLNSIMESAVAVAVGPVSIVLTFGDAFADSFRLAEASDSSGLILTPFGAGLAEADDSTGDVVEKRCAIGEEIR